MSVETLGNIPRFDTALADWLGCVLYLCFMTKRLRGAGRCAVYAAALTVMSAFMILTGDVPLAWFLPCILVSYLLMVAFLHICSDAPWNDVIYYGARAFILGELAASLEWQLYYYMVGRFDIAGAWLRIAVLGLTYLLVFGLMLRLEKFYSGTDASLKVQTREMMVTVLLAVLIYAASNLSYVDVDTPFSGTMTTEIFNIRTLFDLVGTAVLFAHHLQIVGYRNREERDALESVLQAQYVQYRASQESIDLINRKYHDLKHQIGVLRAQSNEVQSSELDRLEQEIRSYEAQNKTGNEVLDTILTSKSLICQTNDITMTCVADGKLLNFISTMDLCSIFGNALENAIEAAQRLPDSRQRLIHLVVAEQKGFLWIKAENTYDGKWQAGEHASDAKWETLLSRLPATTKADSRYHGYGLRSIYETVRKYGGSTQIQTQDEWFRLKILIPLPETASRRTT